MEVENFEEERGGNAGWDARQGRTKILSAILFEIVKAHLEDNYLSWYKQLKNLYYICGPYVNKQKAKQIKDQLKEVAQRIEAKNLNPKYILDSLDKCTEESLICFKEQFGKGEGEEYTEFDLDEAIS